MTEKEINWTVGTTYWKWFFTNSDTMVPWGASIVLHVLTFIHAEDFLSMPTWGIVLAALLMDVGAISMTIYSIFWWRKEKARLNNA